MASQYRRGADFERAVRDLCIKMGAVVVIRSAGSKGLLDLVAWMPSGETWFVQCKLTGKISKADRNDLRDIADIVGAQAVIAHKPGRGQIVLEMISGAGVQSER